jgi:hypothetical protein
MSVKAKRCRKAPLVRLPNADRSCLALLNLPKYRAIAQYVGLVEWLNLAHLSVSCHR